ncbi:MAG: hypothetical protein IJ568_05470 [Bacilli bacterium]|nr:hypothetical protein [Bacilli bacterium]
MEINVNDYVRTKEGYIAKIKKIIGIKEQSNKPYLNFNNCCVLVKNEDDCLGSKGKIIKTAEGTPRGLLNLIEVGDYVNGLKVIDIVENDIYISDYYAKSYIGLVKVKDIKSIVTKEMFEKMEYKVESEVN